MVQHRVSIHHRNSAARLAVVVIPIKLEWADEGKVVTETSTEYKEVSDDSDFSDFGSSGRLGVVGSNFSSISTSNISDDDKVSFPAKFSLPIKTTTTPTSSSPHSKTTNISSSSISSTPDDKNSNFETEALKAHNDYRKKHGCPPLKIDQKLCKYAQEWANELAKENRFEHRRDVPYGENLYCTWSSNPNKGVSGSNCVESWYSEVDQYQFGVEPRSMGTGHFTQVVWKNSKNLGIAKARSATSGKIIVVANYEPAGNFIGQYVENVPAPLK